MFESKDKSFDKDSLQTPQFIFNWLNEKYNFKVDLAASDKHHFCNKYFTSEQSALCENWHWLAMNGFVNPPYSDIDPWIEKAILEADRGFTSVFLIPDFNGEARFEQIARHATTIIHLIGRVSFINPNSGKKYTGNNRGSVIVEFSKKYFETSPQHLYFKTKNIESEYE